MTPSASGLLFVGIDVALEKLNLGRSDSDPLLTVANDPGGIRRIVDLLVPLAPASWERPTAARSGRWSAWRRSTTTPDASNANAPSAADASRSVACCTCPP